MTKLCSLFLILAALFLHSNRAAAAYTPQTLLEATNQARITYHLPALHTNPKLEAAALAFALKEAKTGDFSHHGDWTILNATGYEHSYAGQNLALDFTDTSSTVMAWLNSPGHRANLLFDKYTQTGLAMASSSDGRIYVVQYFGTPVSDPNIGARLR